MYAAYFDQRYPPAKIDELSILTKFLFRPIEINVLIQYAILNPTSEYFEDGDFLVR